MLSRSEQVVIIVSALAVGFGTFYLVYSAALLLFGIDNYNIPSVCGMLMVIFAARVFRDDLEDRKRTLK